MVPRPVDMYMGRVYARYSAFGYFVDKRQSVTSVAFKWT